MIPTAVAPLAPLAPRARGLLLDVGSVLLRSEFDMLPVYCKQRGLPAPRLGPHDPGNDADWQRFIRGEIPLYTDGYWDTVAREMGFASFRELYREFSETIPGSEFHPDMLELVADAKRAGCTLGILSNDMYSISGREFVERAEFVPFDAIVDSTDVGVRKPAPEGYLAAAAAMRLDPSEIVFLDDTPYCVEGARAVGMYAVHVDPIDRRPSLLETRLLLGLPVDDASTERAFRLVHHAERVYQADDIDAIMRCFHPHVVVHWNGEKVAEGLDATRRFHVERLGFGRGDGSTRHSYRLRKALRAVCGHDISAEWESTSTADDGSQVTSRAAEMWKMRGDLIIEWHAYNHRVTQGPA